MDAPLDLSRLDLADLRLNYSRAGLRRAELHADPREQFRRWFRQAQEAGLLEPNAITLATADAAGRPSARTLLLKGVDERGFIFFTNYESRKGRELGENPRASLVVLWKELERQVIVLGDVTKTSRAESDDYFHKRPRGSQLGACVSRQSSVVPDRAFLEGRLAELETKFAGQEVPLPEQWGGYILAPHEIEFWQGRPNRLHDRLRYTRQPDGNWVIERLSP